MSAPGFERADYLPSLGAALASHFPGARKLEFLRYSVNKNYRFTAEGEEYFLRLYRPGKESRETIEAEHDFLRHLQEHGYPVAAPIPLQNEASVAETEGGLFFAVFPFLSGQAPELISPRGAEDWGRALGRLHRISRSYVVPGSAPKRRPWHAASWIQNCTSLISTTVPANLRHVLLKEHEAAQVYLSRLTQGEDEYGLIHNDFHAGNLVQNGAQLAVIDFDDSAYSWFAWDFALPFHRLGGGHMRPDAKGLKAAFVDGYRREKPLSEEWLKCLSAFERIRHLFMIAWLAERRDETKWKEIFPKYAAAHAAYLENSPGL